MMGVGPTLAQTAWLASSLTEAHRLARATRDVAGAQRRLLDGILRENADTDFGRRHCFGRIRTPREYQAAVPLTDYAGFADAIARIARGEARVLTAAPVRLLEPTSGSSGGRKLIPYTRGLQADFARGIAPWIADLYLHDPRLLTGRAYWSVSPVATAEERTAGGLPIGFEDDLVYLGRTRGALARASLAVPAAVRRVDDVETFRYATRLALLRGRDLTLVSIWHPSFLTLLLQDLERDMPRLVDDIERGTLTPPAALPCVAARALCAPASPGRSAEIRQLVERHGSDRVGLLRGLWPRLRLVSCWTGAQAATPAAQLAQLIPHARVQGKGLIATEGFVTLPITGLAAPLLAVRTHFFEFIPVDGGAPRLAHELDAGRDYSVVLTTSGGLYRYRLGDLVRCVGHRYACPLLDFVGREGDVSDHVGEKLAESFVRETMGKVLAKRRLAPAFALLTWQEGAYALCIEAAEAADGDVLAAAAALDEALAANPQYGYSRRLGQLGPVRAFRVEGDGHLAHLAACVARGQRLGDVKPASLWRHAGWQQTAHGRWLSDLAGGDR
jgi:hypothetical protein